MYARSARTLVPEVRREHLLPGGAGVRAQAVDSSGRLLDDFVIEEAGPTIHVLNAPSPGATSSLAIGTHIASIAARHLGR
jgi:L-2-hydroxyglutarate oxidase LhgO